MSKQSPTSSNVTWHSTKVTKPMREKRNGHRGAVIWLTGLSGPGKPTLAMREDGQGGMVNAAHEEDQRSVVAILNAEAGGPTKVVVNYNQGS
mgnify:CR=1 FL=1